MNIVPKIGVFNNLGNRVEVDMTLADSYHHNSADTIRCVRLDFDGFMRDGRGERKFRVGDLLCVNDFGCTYVTTKEYANHAYAKDAIAFEEFHKIPRLSRPIIITEKIDGTNGCIYIGEDSEFLVGSRTRWITPEADNHGFARWAYDHKDELITLGPGRHFGEWWGNGIQRGYGLKNGDKRFSLFNTTRWCPFGKTPMPSSATKMQQVLPECVGLVPVLYDGPHSETWITWCLDRLSRQGSYASHGFMRPEGVVIYHTAGNVMFKKTLENDDAPKSVPMSKVI